MSTPINQNYYFNAHEADFKYLTTREGFAALQHQLQIERIAAENFRRNLEYGVELGTISEYEEPYQRADLQHMQDAFSRTSELYQDVVRYDKERDTNPFDYFTEFGDLTREENFAALTEALRVSSTAYNSFNTHLQNMQISGQPAAMPPQDYEQLMNQWQGVHDRWERLSAVHSEVDSFHNNPRQWVKHRYGEGDPTEARLYDPGLELQLARMRLEEQRQQQQQPTRQPVQPPGSVSASRLRTSRSNQPTAGSSRGTAEAGPSSASHRQRAAQPVTSPEKKGSGTKKSR